MISTTQGYAGLKQTLRISKGSNGGACAVLRILRRVAARVCVFYSFTPYSCICLIYTFFIFSRIYEVLTLRSMSSKLQATKIKG
jgi:hypothetical protein